MNHKTIPRGSTAGPAYSERYVSMKSQREPEKYIIFQVASYWYVLPVTEILKIVNCPSPSQGGMVDLGMVQLGPHTVQLLNLHRLLDINSSAAATYGFLVVLRTQSGLWGIPLEQTPDLIELSPVTLKPVALGGERFQSSAISHVGLLEEQAGQRTLLRLDVNALVQQQNGALPKQAAPIES
ncbi:chemotaxis protein CheW [Leptothoe kymatousa]|uniref:Chemotaxis protein CheW n=1 Tax=Leptothoe kymatousa TAU-MAC 1615 TaxID=2364775 RepID=A0ABS5Y2G2_9CYAN|nr:chemotaxis protein CheW [Leptothoe kymatousa]MBT9312000.1 chemotaxis protein CheW [Leptothoe kymatousa TAU-MAC 1615]